MKKAMIVLMAASMFSAAIPAFAMDHGDMDMPEMADTQTMQHGNAHDPNDVQCARDCDLLLKNCAQDVDSIQQHIAKLKAAIAKDGADQAKLNELKVLKVKLSEANETLKNLTKPGH